MQHYKKTPSGIKERVDLLNNTMIHSKKLLKMGEAYVKNGLIAVDDLLDACVLAVCASSTESQMVSLPSIPEIDMLGYPMRIVYSKL